MNPVILRGGWMAFDETWTAMSIEEQIVFSLDWEADHSEGWAQVRTIDSTSTVLRILDEIALHLANVEAHRALGMSESEIDRTLPAAVATVNRWEERVVSVAQTDPRHAGAWWGTVSIGFDDGAYDYNDSGTARVFGAATVLPAFDILSRHARGSDEDMVAFVHAERSTGGLEHLATTLLALVHNGDTWDLLSRYLVGLRGHHPDEAGDEHHHLRDMVRTGGSVDTNDPLRLIMGAVEAFLHRSPEIHPGLPISRWRTTVTAYLNRWVQAMGDHRDGLTWLKERLERHHGEWGEDAQSVIVLGVRETERTVTDGVTEQLSEMHSEVQRALRQVSEARSRGTTVSRTEALQQLRTEVESWKRQFQAGTSSSLAAHQQSETAASGDVEADILVAGGTIELSETITLGLEQKIETSMQALTEQSGSTTETESTTESETVTAMLQSVITELEALERSVNRTLSATRSRHRAVSRVIDMDAEGEGQIAQTRRGVSDAIALVDAAL